MKIVPLYEVKNRLSAYVQEAAQGPIVITKNGKPCAALVHVEADEDIETLLLSRNPEFLALLDKSVEKTEKQGGRPLSAVKEEVRKRERKQRKAA